MTYSLYLRQADDPPRLANPFALQHASRYTALSKAAARPGNWLDPRLNLMLVARIVPDTGYRHERGALGGSPATRERLRECRDVASRFRPHGSGAEFAHAHSMSFTRANEGAWRRRWPSVRSMGKCINASGLQPTADRDGRGAPEVDDLTVLIGGIGAQKGLRRWLSWRAFPRRTCSRVLRHGEPMSHHGIGDDLDEDLVQDRDHSRLRR